MAIDNPYDPQEDLSHIKKGIGTTRLEQLRECVASHSARQIEGMIVDVQSANVILTVYDALQDPENKEKFMKMHLSQAINVAWKLAK